MIAGDGPWHADATPPAAHGIDLHALFHEIDLAVEQIWRSDG